MPRPKQCRYVATTPSVTYFKPRGIPMTALEEVCLGVEELEALRLADGARKLNMAYIEGILRNHEKK